MKLAFCSRTVALAVLAAVTAACPGPSPREIDAVLELHADTVDVDARFSDLRVSSPDELLAFRQMANAASPHAAAIAFKLPALEQATFAFVSDGERLSLRVRGSVSRELFERCVTSCETSPTECALLPLRRCGGPYQLSPWENTYELAPELPAQVAATATRLQYRARLKADAHSDARDSALPAFERIAALPETDALAEWMNQLDGAFELDISRPFALDVPTDWSSPARQLAEVFLWRKRAWLLEQAADNEHKCSTPDRLRTEPFELRCVRLPDTAGPGMPEEDRRLFSRRLPASTARALRVASDALGRHELTAAQSAMRSTCKRPAPDLRSVCILLGLTAPTK